MSLTKNIAALAAIGCGFAPLLAQEQPPAEGKAEAKSEQKAGQEAEALIANLGDSSFKARVQAEQALRAMGQKALPALREAAEHSQDAEVQWRARRLLRQIERGEAGLQKRAEVPPTRPEVEPDQPGLPPLPDMRHRFDDLFRQLERDFGIDIPRHRFFQDDFFQDLRGQMESMQQQMQKALQGGTGQSHGMQMQVGPGGVKVEIKTRNEKGEEEVKTYEAPDLDTFQQKYPGVLEQHGLGGGLRFWFDQGQGQGLPQLRPLLRWRAGQPWPRQQDDERDQDLLPPVDAAPPPADRRLGVLIKDQIPADLRDYLGLEPGQGLMVEQVQDGTLAQQLGVAAGDIVLKIGKQAIGSAADVQQALGAIGTGEAVEVEVLRKGNSLLLSGKKPAAAPEPAAPKKLQLRPGRQ